MAQQKKSNNFLKLLVVAVVVLALIFGWDGFGPGGGEKGDSGDGKGVAENGNSDPGNGGLLPDTGRQPDSVAAKGSPPDSVAAPPANEFPADTLAIPRQDSAVASGEKKGLLRFNEITVLKRGGQLLYEINGQETDNLSLGLTWLDFSKEVFVKFGGNVSYAEEKATKEFLALKQVAYTVSND